LGELTNRIILERRKIIRHQAKSVIPRKNLDPASIQKAIQAWKNPKLPFLMVELIPSSFPKPMRLSLSVC
jgi:hypothetical protein